MSILYATKDNFDSIINNEDIIIVDFYADWCGPCKMLSPILEEISQDRSDIKILKINVDSEKELAQKYGVMSIPTLILFKSGKEVNKNIGFISKDELIKFINE